MTFQLTAGSCELLQNATPEDVDVFNTQHVMQILAVRQIRPAGSESARYRIIISDGIRYMQAMLSTQLNSMAQESTLGRNTVVVLENLTCFQMQLQNKMLKLIIILGLRVLAQTTDRIGEPLPIEDGNDRDVITPAVAEPTPAVASSSTTPAPTPAKPVSSVQTSNTALHQQPLPKPSGRAGSIYPIDGLRPSQTNWTIKARVTQKSNIKIWSNALGEVKLFNVTFMDDSGEISGIASNLVADELYPKLEEGNVYYVSKARVNPAKKKFPNVNNGYELIFERNTEVEELEVTDVPTTT